MLEVSLFGREDSVGDTKELVLDGVDVAADETGSLLEVAVCELSDVSLEVVCA